MSEKRFEVDVDHILLVWDTEKNKRLEIENIVDCLNELFEHNLYLQRLLKSLAEVTGESIEDTIERYTNNKEIYTTSKRPMRFIPNKVEDGGENRKLCSFSLFQKLRIR